jgi:hypothetical protein
MTLSSYLFQPNYRSLSCTIFHNLKNYVLKRLAREKNRENKDEDDDDNEDILAREGCITEGI